jgi:L-aminopeptidase/D-esterase-like protein
MEKAQAIVLTGGSAFGLASVDGVMRFCENRGWGFNTGWGIVPIVPAACLFDLAVGNSKARPGAEMGIEACNNARPLDESPMGNVGAGTGASVGKYGNPARAMKSGFGWFTADKAGVRVSALVAVNAWWMTAQQNREHRRVLERLRDDGDHAARMIQVFLTDMAAFPTMNAAYAGYFMTPFPARSTVQVAALPKGACVEIEAIAHA